MGAANPYVKYDTTVKNDDKWQSFLKKYSLGNKEGKKFFDTFKKMDAKKKGGINFKQFAKVWKVSKEDYAITERFFDVLKKEGEEDNIHFQEWAVMTYDFCTLRMDGLVEWTFRLFDRAGSGKMSAEEFKTMCKLCLGDDAGTPGTKAYDQTMTLMKGLSKSKNGDITLQEFRGAEAKGSALLFVGLMDLQTKLQKKIFSPKWWEDATKIRVAQGLGRKPIDVYNSGGTYERPVKGAKKLKKGAVAPAPKPKKVVREED